jgi:predicted nucleic acid-binding protein
MGVVLLDTNVVSFLLKGDNRADLYRPHIRQQNVVISFMTVAELFQWAFVRNWGERRQKELEAHLQSYTVLPFDIALCRQWGEIRADCRAKGRPISPQDAWIAATAMRYEIPLVTHNPRDFEVLDTLIVITEAP